MAVMGDSENGNYIQRFMSSVVNYTPTVIAEKAGVEDLFQATTERRCHQYRCFQH